MEPESTKRECWAVTFGNSYNDTERMVAAGYDNGDIKMWDLRNMSLYWDTNVGNGVCGLEYDRTNIKVNIRENLYRYIFIFSKVRSS